MIADGADEGALMPPESLRELPAAMRKITPLLAYSSTTRPTWFEGPFPEPRLMLMT